MLGFFIIVTVNCISYQLFRLINAINLYLDCEMRLASIRLLNILSVIFFFFSLPLVFIFDPIESLYSRYFYRKENRNLRFCHMIESLKGYPSNERYFSSLCDSWDMDPPVITDEYEEPFDDWKKRQYAKRKIDLEVFHYEPFFLDFFRSIFCNSKK